MLKYFVRDMLDFQQIKANKMKKDITTFNLKDAINEVLKMQEYIAKKNNINLISEFQMGEEESKDFQITTDYLRLQQILLNLVSNSLKYTQIGGFVKVTVSILSIEQNENKEHYLKVAVWDNGLGIQKDDQKKLFKLFGTIKNNRNLNKKGIGLGLVICKRIIQQFNGDI